jgi:hypothetical protein
MILYYIMGKRLRLRSLSNNTAAIGGGGILNSGIFGMFGTVVQCKSDDTSMFCTLSKIVNGLMMILFLLLIFYILFMIFKYFLRTKKSGGLGPRMDGGYIVGSKTSQCFSPCKTLNNIFFCHTEYIIHHVFDWVWLSVLFFFFFKNHFTPFLIEKEKVLFFKGLASKCKCCKSYRNYAKY